MSGEASTKTDARCGCAPLEQLERLVSDQLGSPERDQVCADIQECPACQQVLERLSASFDSATTAQAARNALDVDVEFLEKIKAWPPALPHEVQTEFRHTPRDEPVNLIEDGLIDSDDTFLSSDRTSTGRYRIIRRLGQGGMGVVYLAHDTQLDRRVAVKIPHAESEFSPDAVARFQREARAAAALEHPNFCRIYDFGQIEGRHFIAMAYVEGQSLRTIIDHEGPLERERSIAWVQRLALAMAKAHERGIVHRDLKPSNILINGEGEPVITDFGLARWLEGDNPELTRSGVLVGTPHYMAPERVECDINSIGPASDIYSLGVVLYELLTGRRPFEGSAARVLGLIVSQEASPLSAIRPEIDRKVEQICLRRWPRVSTSASPR